MNLPIHVSTSGLAKVPLDKEGVGKYGCVSSLLTIVHALSFLELFYLKGTKCYNCNKTATKRSLLRMPIMVEEILTESVQGCINQKFFTKNDHFYCEKC